jgi:uncharacterized protein
MKIALILASAVLTLSTAAAAQSYPPLQGRPVIDAANVLDAEAEAQLNARLFEYERTTGHQLVVATVPSLEGRDIETYANEYFRELGLGDKDLDDGVLLLHAPTERKVRIEVGYGLEGVLTDADSALIIQNTITPAFKAGNFAEGIDGGVTDIIAETSMTMEELAAMEARKKAADEQAFAAFWDFIGTVLVWVLAAIATFFSGKGLLWVANIPRRRAARKAAIKRGVNAMGDIIRLVIKKAKEDDLRAQEEVRIAAERVRTARLAEQRRKDEEKRQAEEARQAAAAHAAMLAAMTPLARAQYEANERQKARDQARREAEARQAAQERERERAAAQRVADAEAAVRRREQAARDEDESRRRRARQQEDDDRRRRDDDNRRSTYDSGPSYSPSPPSYDGGGGSSGGGGASGDY